MQCVKFCSALVINHGFSMKEGVFISESSIPHHEWYYVIKHVLLFLNRSCSANYISCQGFISVKEHLYGQ